MIIFIILTLRKLGMVKMEFKLFGCDERGMYYPDSGRIVIYLSNHETIEDVYKTITHELIHNGIHKAEIKYDEALSTCSKVYSLLTAASALTHRSLNSSFSIVSKVNGIPSIKYIFTIVL